MTFSMMFGYIEGITDADEIDYCPYCGAEIVSRYADGTAQCEKCNARFGVVRADFGVIEEEE